ncbi:beta-lactamase regulating signal transducer with metallopeptidase domain [Lachnospiraceae bacterium PF1-22]|uniref:M56 family metallopeptidase n=1 Tax=Ohessyouella blattaphilus TaxID=2949333 RepID=UPI0025610729|nr:M56 family metallopeptidase [Lachnospiraceae bacterium OttesenSCG-928-J05]
MKITFFSFFMAMFWSSLIIFCVFLFRKLGLLTKKMSIISILLIYFFSIFRALFPFDFSDSRGIALDGLFSDFYKVVYLNKFPFLYLSTSLFQLFLIVWLSGALILLITFARQYCKILTVVHTYEKANSPDLTNALKRVHSQIGKTLDISILYSKDISVPMGIGIINKTIILPLRIYSENDLYFTLLHEYTHFVNHDLLIKLLTQLYCCLFWWNPVVYLLKVDLAQTLELKCDLYVTEEMTINQKIEYLTCLMNTLKESNSSQTRASYNSVALVAEGSHMVERFERISKNIDSPPKKAISFSFLSLLIIIVMLSYLFVFQPEYEPPADEFSGPNTYEITKENNYILLENDKFFVIYNNHERSEISKESALFMETQGFKIVEGDKDK